MNGWVEAFVMLSVAGTAVMVCTLLLSTISRNLFSAKWQYLNRKLALLFYLVPIFLIGQKIPYLSWSTEVKIKTQIVSLGEAITQQSIPLELALGILVVWLCGVIVFGAWYIYCYVKFTKEIKRTSLPVLENGEAYQLLHLNLRKMNIKGNVKLAYNIRITSPVLVGLIKPTIILPFNEMSTIELDMAIQHELIHFKRKDLWTKMLVLVASILHWFNPFIHMLRKQIHVWSELSCDEEVVSEMSHLERKRYGETILSMVEQKAKTTSFGIFLSESKKDIERRLTMMLNVKKIKKHALILTVLMMMAIGGIGITASAMAAKHVPSVVDDNVEAKEGTLDSQVKGEASGGSYELISVKRSDESKFPPEEWKKVLKQIEKGEVYWEEETTSKIIKNREAVYDPNDQAKGEGK
ncbi:M56 family metallopeptidase [Bacillus niameyensis]|uniref:M56 family metallopeptidase n=1 Tax=Bacillus niameyensis TaxID=1522308 RepID=UPI00078041BD|nr:M56 family metallopeptidase [Bacillus niameyensis]